MFLFGFILNFFLCAQSVDEEPIPDEDFFFLEEYFLFDEPFFFDESLLSADPSLDEEIPPGEESLLAEEPSPDDESLPGEEPSPDKETILSEEPALNEETILSEEPVKEPSIDEETLLSEEPSFDEFFLNDGSLVFEAPPLIIEAPTFETRSLYAIFPKLSRVQRRTVMSAEGLRYYFGKDGSPMLVPDPDSGIDIISSVMAKKPSHIIEAMVLIPYNQRELDLLDIYNALGKIENIKDQITYLDDYEFNIFVESTRLISARNRKPIPDPPPADTLPYSETMHLRLKDQFFGNLYIRGDISISLYGITYNMTNFTDVRYLLIPVIKAERCAVIIYLEPVKEGILIYSITGFYLPGFIADRVNLTPNINRRIEVFVNWITEGLRRQENRTDGAIE